MEAAAPPYITVVSMPEDNIINVIFNEQQLIDHVLNHVPPIPQMTMAEMLDAACGPMEMIWVKRVPKPSLVKK